MLEQVAQICRYPVHGGVRVQVGWDPGQPDLVYDLEDGKWGWNYMIFKVSFSVSHFVILLLRKSDVKSYYRIQII